MIQAEQLLNTAHCLNKFQMTPASPFVFSLLFLVSSSSFYSPAVLLSAQNPHPATELSRLSHRNLLRIGMLYQLYSYRSLPKLPKYSSSECPQSDTVTHGYMSMDATFLDKIRQVSQKDKTIFLKRCCFTGILRDDSASQGDT